MMSIIVNNSLLDTQYADSEWSAQDIYDAIEYYEKVQSSATENVVVDAVRNILIKLHDFLLRMANNLVTVVTRLLNDVKRSELEVFRDSHGLAMARLSSISYSAIYKLTIPMYHYNERPIKMSEKMHEMFSIFDIYSRLDKIIRLYKQIPSTLKNKDFSKCMDLVEDIDSLNISKSVKDIEASIKSSVLMHSSSNVMTIGEVFSSTSEIESFYKSLLRDVREIQNIEKIGKQINKLIDALNEIVDVLGSIRDSGADISSLKKVSTASNSTVDLIDTYAITIHQWTHLEHWLVNVLKVAVKHV
jgi:hypothetical protein